MKNQQFPTYLQDKRTYRFDAPAKVNLGLRIIGRDPEGFHKLETIFHTISLMDTIHVQVDPQGPEVTNLRGEMDKRIPRDGANSAIRAVDALRRMGCHLGTVDLLIEKGIPVGGGLGGSSADSAAILKGLQHYLPRTVTAKDLAKTALSLGSDVPFLLQGGCAHALGRGEILTSLPAYGNHPLWLIIPPTSCSTPHVFKALHDHERKPLSPLGHMWWKQQWHRNQFDFLQNDLLKAALRVQPSLTRMVTWLKSQGFPWGMSGSGSTFFTLSQPELPLPRGYRCVACSFTDP